MLMKWILRSSRRCRCLKTERASWRWIYIEKKRRLEIASPCSCLSYIQSHLSAIIQVFLIELIDLK